MAERKDEFWVYLIEWHGPVPTITVEAEGTYRKCRTFLDEKKKAGKPTHNNLISSRSADRLAKNL